MCASKTKQNSFYPLDVVRAEYATATWLGAWLGGWVTGWVSITRRYCIKMAKPS